MNEEVRHFSLRKLSVGLASVLVGVSIFGASQTVKADTVANSQVSTVTSNAQSFDTQKNENAVKSSFSSDNQANNAKSNLIQTQVEAKKDQKQDSVPKTQEVNDSSNLDAEKSIVSSSSAPKINNQSNDHADDNSQTQTSQKLDLTKNSKKLAKKVLATNLTETNGETQDISKITDPSKIDASHFADGTRWTPAGWTRTDKNTKVAKSSKFSISFGNAGNINKNTGIYDDQKGDWIWTHVKDISFTIDKNDLKSGNKILIGTIQQAPTQDKQIAEQNRQSQLIQSEKSPDMRIDVLGNQTYQITSDNNEIGYISVEEPDLGEMDFYLNVTKTYNNVVNDIACTYTFPSGANFLANPNDNAWDHYNGFYSHKNNLHYPLHYSLISNSNILNYDIDFKKDAIKTVSDNDISTYWYNNISNNIIGIIRQINQNQYTGQITSTGFVAKITDLSGEKTNFANTTWGVGIDIHLINADNKLTNESYNAGNAGGNFTKVANNLTALDLWNMTPENSAYFSMQSDGSVIISIKTNLPTIDKKLVKSDVDASYLANVQDPDHYQQILTNTLNNTKAPLSWIIDFGLGSSVFNKAIQITDLTPASISSTNLGSTTMISGINTSGSSTSSDIETYKNVKISYVDDDDNSKSVSSDSMTGRQNKASTYTVNIPKGYYLDDNNTSTGYTWNADHTAISYTFNEDQAKNDANPIEIHLKHKHTAITDSSQLQTTGKRTITITLPHQDKPMIIVQTVGYKRTGDLDEATNTQTYTDWVFDADTSNVTVNGQISTQYQAYILKDGIVNYAPIKLPHINGYKAHLVRNKINPAMLMVSFVAVPTETKPSNPVEVAPSKPSANPDKSDIDDLQKRSVTELNSNNSNRTMPLDNSTYKVEAPTGDTTIDLSNLMIAQPVHAQTRTKIHVHKHFKLRKHGKKHIIKHIKHRKKVAKHSKKHAVKHFKHRKKMARQFKKYRL